MPLHALAVAAIVAGVAAAAAGVAYMLSEAKGKTILLVGPRMAGKTTLRTFLTHGTITEEYLRTRLTQREDAKVTDQQMNVYQLTVIDVDGGEDSYQEWKKHAVTADAVCFVVDVSRFDERGYWDFVAKRARQLHRWELPQWQRRFLVLTHTDCLSPSRNDDEVRKMRPVYRLTRLLTPHKTTVGNLLDEEDIQRVVWDVLEGFKQ